MTCFNFESLNKVSPLCCFGIVEATPSVQHSAELRKLQDWRVLGAETLMDQRIKEMLWWCGMCFLPLLSAGLRDDTCWCGYWLLCTAVEAEKVPSASLCLQAAMSQSACGCTFECWATQLTGRTHGAHTMLFVTQSPLIPMSPKPVYLCPVVYSIHMCTLQALSL